MAGWYEVIKTIKGRPYRYQQRTYRLGGKVCTQSRYIGPASPAEVTRIRAETALRKGGPSQTAVRSAIARLSAPGRAESRWKKPWDNSRPRRQAVRQLAELNRVIASTGATIEPANAAFYNWTEDRIGIPAQARFHRIDDGDADREFYLTLLHELAHWTGHHSRLNRTMPRRSMDNYFEVYAQEELIAEATANIVAEHLGFGTEAGGLHAYYFQHFLDEVPDRAAALAKTEREAHRAACLILSRVNTTL